MKETIKIDLLGTIAVMNWADEHPDFVFDHTTFVDKYGKGYIMVSDVQEEDFRSTLDCIDNGIYEWYDLPNGWRRVACAGRSWLCNNGNRYLFMDC